jgi:hypothetical protein
MADVPNAYGRPRHPLLQTAPHYSLAARATGRSYQDPLTRIGTLPSLGRQSAVRATILRRLRQGSRVELINSAITATAIREGRRGERKRECSK